MPGNRRIGIHGNEHRACQPDAIDRNRHFKAFCHRDPDPVALADPLIDQAGRKALRARQQLCVGQHFTTATEGWTLRPFFSSLEKRRVYALAMSH